MSRPEWAVQIAAEASRKDTDTVGWGLFIDKTGPGPHSRVTVTNEDGFSSTHVLLFTEGLSVNEIITQFLDETIDGVRSARATPPQAQGNARGKNK